MSHTLKTGHQNSVKNLGKNGCGCWCGCNSLTTEEVTCDLDKNVKMEQIKLEKLCSDDEFDAGPDFADIDDDDDLDDEPLTKLASRIPKTESMDATDLMDNATGTLTLKRKSTKTKTPAKKIKKKEPKATASKDKPEKKKKDLDPYLTARRNAEVVVKFATAYPFRLPEDAMVCVYCCESYDDPSEYRKHMDKDHLTFKLRMAFMHCSEGYIKVDVTDLRCRVCSQSFDSIDEIVQHLREAHDADINPKYEIGVQPFKLEKDRLSCAICCLKSPCIRQLSRHIQTHFLKYTCEACGKSYATITTLRHHITYSHTGQARICRKCKKTFNSLDARRKHLAESRKCWAHLCMICGERFMTWTLKQVHLNQVHGTPKRSHVCPECGEIFLDRKKYRAHFIISHTDDNFVCSCCGMKFDTKRNLDDHRVVHTKEKLFPCPVCPKSFPRKKNLVQHMWIHSEHKRFGCQLCNKQFNQRVSWKTHMRSYHPDLDLDLEATKNNNVKIVLTVLKTDE